MTPSFETLRAAMIDSQLRPTGVNDVRVLEAFMPVPREAFVPVAQRGLAYIDAEIPLGNGRVVMEPMLFGNLVMQADLRATDRVLLIGAASGYEAAVIARLVARVIAVEEDGALASAARVALGQVGAMNADVVNGPLTQGWPQGAPYDVLFLNGSAEMLPPVLVEQLAEDGRFVGVLRDERGALHASAGRKGGGVLGLTDFLDAGGAPLPGFERARGFRF